MSLEDDLKDKALELISKQMANWVVEIQRHIAEHQGNLVRALDELQESVARYDERIDQDDIERTIHQVVAQQPPPPPPVATGPGMDRLRASVLQIDKGTSLSEVLTYLVDEASQYVDRAAMFIVKGTNAIGWYARGIEPADAVKQINVPLNADTAFRIVYNGKHALRGHLAHTPGTAQALARLGGRPQGILGVPLVLRDKLAAILYCDSTQDEVPPAAADVIETLVLFAGKTIDILSLAPKGAGPAPARTTSGNTAERAAAIRADTDDVRARAGVGTGTSPRVAAQPPTNPPRPASAPPEEGSSTVMFSAAQVRSQMPPAQAPPARPAAQAAAPPAATIRPEDQKAHDDAKRFARLVVSEIKLYNEPKVNEGRRHRDLYERLKEDIERGRAMYNERVPQQVRDQANYFFDELVRILAGGDAGALGPM